jgi:hypothetical protein
MFIGCPIFYARFSAASIILRASVSVTIDVLPPLNVFARGL